MWDAKAGSDLKHFREETLKWSQGRLAAELGCNQSTVSRIEAGEPPSGPVLRLLNILRDQHRAAA